MPNLVDFALSMLQRNPQVSSNQNAQNLIEVLRSGDAERGQQIARNICESRGVSEQDMAQQARRFFGI